MKYQLERSEDRRILDWLTPVDYGPQQSDYFNKRQPGTGKWLLGSREFQGWLATGKRTLFCPGIPGAGKTFLTSIVVNHLTSKFYDDPGTGIAYIYCSYQRYDEQDLDSLLASILKQLAGTHSSLPGSVGDLYTRHSIKQTRPSTNDLLEALRAVAAIYTRVFIVVDALDECQTSDGCRSKFLSSLFDLQTYHNINIFSTSRFLPEITTRFEGGVSREIRAHISDVASYLEGHKDELPDFVQRDQKLLREIILQVSRAADGM